jgi:hypothetical protein
LQQGVGRMSVFECALVAPVWDLVLRVLSCVVNINISFEVCNCRAYLHRGKDIHMWRAGEGMLPLGKHYESLKNVRAGQNIDFTELEFTNSFNNWEIHLFSNWHSHHTFAKVGAVFRVLNRFVKNRLFRSGMVAESRTCVAAMTARLLRAKRIGRSILSFSTYKNTKISRRNLSLSLLFLKSEDPRIP